jgi:hypothetical protein
VKELFEGFLHRLQAPLHNMVTVSSNRRSQCQDSILLQIVSHEQKPILRVSAVEYERFRKLPIAHGSGLPPWTGL